MFNLTSRVQTQSLPAQPITIGAGSSSGMAPVVVAGLMAPNPYPLSMASPLSVAPTGAASASDAGSSASGQALREGPLNPNFRVEEQVPERYSMGRGGINVAPGREVCLDPAGCGTRVRADQMSRLELQGPERINGKTLSRFDDVDQIVGASTEQQLAWTGRGLAQRLLSWIGRTP